jgi:hypothetical protein
MCAVWVRPGHMPPDCRGQVRALGPEQGRVTTTLARPAAIALTEAVDGPTRRSPARRSVGAKRLMAQCPRRGRTGAVGLRGAAAEDARHKPVRLAGAAALANRAAHLRLSQQRGRVGQLTVRIWKPSIREGAPNMAYDIASPWGFAHGPESGTAWRLGIKRPHDAKRPKAATFPMPISAQRPTVYCTADGVMP